MVPYVFDKEKGPDFGKPQIVTQEKPLTKKNESSRPINWGYYGFKIEDNTKVQTADKKELVKKALSKGRGPN